MIQMAIMLCLAMGAWQRSAMDSFSERIGELDERTKAKDDGMTIEEQAMKAAAESAALGWVCVSGVRRVCVGCVPASRGRSSSSSRFGVIVRCHVW